MKLALALVSLSLALALRENGVFDARSADVLLASKDARTDGHVIFVDSSKYLFASSSPSELPATSLSNVFSASLGVQPLNAEPLPSFVSNTLAARAQASVLVALDSVGSSNLHGMPGLNKLAEQGAVSAGLNMPSFPIDSASLSASLAAGATPSVHGIVSKTWLGENGVERHAYMENSADFSAVSANLADIVLQTFGSKSLLVSMSSDRALAGAHCVNPALQQEAGSFLCVSAEGEFASSMAAAQAGTGSLAEQLLSSSILTALPLGVSVSMERNAVTIGTVSFDLGNEAHKALFSEIVFAESLLHSLSSGRLAQHVSGGSTTHIALSVAGLTSLINAHVSNEHFLTALSLVDAFVPEFLNRLALVFSDKMVSSVVLLGSARDTSVSPEVLAAVSDAFPHTEAAQLRRFLPDAIYLSEQDRASLSEGCARLSEQLPEIKVTCVSRPARSQRAETGRRVLSVDNGVPGYAAIMPDSLIPVTQNDIEVYQIALWTTICLAFTLLFAAYATCCMSFKRDTVLFGTFNVAWEPRGGRSGR